VVSNLCGWSFQAPACLREARRASPGSMPCLPPWLQRRPSCTHQQIIMPSINKTARERATDPTPAGRQACYYTGRDGRTGGASRTGDARSVWTRKSAYDVHLSTTGRLHSRHSATHTQADRPNNVKAPFTTTTKVESLKTFPAVTTPAGVCGKFFTNSIRTHTSNETVRSITRCLPVSDRVKSFRLRFHGHLARSAPEEDHHRVIAAALRPPTDWTTQEPHG